MALIQCPKCKNEISNLAISCPNCGFSLNTNESHQTNNLNQKAGGSVHRIKILLVSLLIVIVIGLSFCIWFFFFHEATISSPPNQSDISSDNENIKELSVYLESGQEILLLLKNGDYTSISKYNVNTLAEECKPKISELSKNEDEESKQLTEIYSSYFIGFSLLIDDDYKDSEYMRENIVDALTEAESTYYKYLQTYAPNLVNSEVAATLSANADIEKLNEIGMFLCYDLGENLGSIQNYDRQGTDVSGDNLDIDFALDTLDTEMQKLEKYDASINSLSDSKFDNIKTIWKKLYSQTNNIYSIINESKPVARREDPTLEKEMDLWNQYYDALYDECVSSGVW